MIWKLLLKSIGLHFFYVFQWISFEPWKWHRLIKSCFPDSMLELNTAKSVGTITSLTFETLRSSSASSSWSLRFHSPKCPGKPMRFLPLVTKAGLSARSKRLDKALWVESNGKALEKRSHRERVEAECCQIRCPLWKNAETSASREGSKPGPPPANCGPWNGAEGQQGLWAQAKWGETSFRIVADIRCMRPMLKRMTTIVFRIGLQPKDQQEKTQL